MTTWAGKTFMKSCDDVYILVVTDRDGDEHYEGVYSTREAAQQRAEMIKEWDVSIDDFRIIEDLIRESAED